MSFLGFGAPLILIALVVLPLVWFLLRTTPPKPQYEPFPPLGILRQIVQEEQTAHKTPWWLVLLRLLLAALIILALAQPLVNPRQLLTREDVPLVLMIDNGFAATPHWQNQIMTAKKLIQEAQKQDLLVYIIATAEPANEAVGPYRASEALTVIDSLNTRSIFPDRNLAIRRLEEINHEVGITQLAYLNDGLANGEDLKRIGELNLGALLWYQGTIDGLIGLKGVENDVDFMRVQGLRSRGEEQKKHLIAAYDERGRRLGEAEMIFAPGQRQAQAEFSLPLEIRNDIVSLKVEDATTAAATYLTSPSDKRQRIAFLGVGTGEMVQPLLTPLYYPMQALAPFGDLILANKNSPGEQIEQLLDANPALLVMGDETTIPSNSRQKVIGWLEAGGTLLRFAGSRLAANATNDELLPVRLRRGERTMGGAMSWKSPQKIAPINPQSLLFGLEVPENITVSRQILAEPEPQLFDKSWLNLEDGTPLVTAETYGRGRIIFIHTTASPDWSNLALSGFFVEMLQRFVLSANAPSIVTMRSTERDTDTDAMDRGSLGIQRHLPPWQILSPQGQLLAPPGFVQPLDVEQFEKKRPDFYHPPGLYGREEERIALNLLEEEAQFDRLEIPENINVLLRTYEENNNLPLEGFLWAMALILFTLDCLIMVRLRGAGNGQSLFSSFRGSNKPNSLTSAFMAIFLLGGFFFLQQTFQAQANEDEILAQRAAKTHLAYVITGNHGLDELSQAGLESLSQFITDRTTIKLGEVLGVDLGQDELGFFPLLYWPIESGNPMPNEEAIARLGRYMHQGGSVLFDTRDQLESGLGFEGAPTANTAYLRQLLGNLDIPPLEPAPSDHVVARSFYIMPDFPGRYRGSDLWLEALPLSENTTQADFSASSIPGLNPIVRSGDGVSPILITANDFIGAWAQNAHNDWLYPTIPDEPVQRLWAFRGGLNIVLYMLSGNYKADQVHAPELLRRLGE